MATKPPAPPLLSGQAALDASYPRAQTPLGGQEFGVDGMSGSRRPNPNSNGAIPVPGDAPGGAQSPAAPGEDFAGMGSWLEGDDSTVFSTLNELVLRQELLAISHLNQDKHYTLVKLGFPFSELTKDDNKSTYRQTIPTGMSTLSIAAVPNQAWDLVNKATEAILVDDAQPKPSPLNDSEEAQLAAEMAERFLTEDAGENGTNDIWVRYQALDKALTCATSFTEDWIDPVGGGYVPLQILAHPLAESPDNPLIGPQGMPTPDPILRYVTAPQGGQFTDDPAAAAPQWLPKTRATVWPREHWRIYPENVSITHAQKAIGLLYCTLGEAKTRWPDVAKMDQPALDALLNWMPPRGLVLLPPFQRARFRTSSDANKSGTSDERILFYYQLYQKAAPDHKRGAEVAISGADGGTILGKDTLSAMLTIPDDSTENAGKPQKAPRCMDIPLSQLTPRADPDDRDPQGRCYMELFVGATEFNASLITGFLEALNQWLHPDSYSYGTSPVQGFQVEESRITGDAIPIFRIEDRPTYGNQPPIPTNFFDAYDRNDGAIRSIASLNKPVTGSDTSQEISGKARQIAVQQGMVGLSRMQHPMNAYNERRYRIKIQLVMRKFTTEQTLRYVGEDGSYKAQAWTGVDFALVGDVGIQAGTGTMMPPDQKVQYIANLKAEGFFADPLEAADAARATFAERLGLPDDPHSQYIERCVALWLQGPPADQPGQVPWAQQWQQYTQQKQAYDAQQQQMQQQQQQQQVMDQQAMAQAPVDAANAQAAQVKQQEQEHAAQAEQQKASTSLQLEQAKHQMAMEAKAADHANAQQVAASTPAPAAPQPPPEIIVQPPDLAPIAAAISEMRNLVAAVLSKEPAPHVPQEPPVIHVHPAAAPNVHVAPANVHVPSGPAPTVNVHAAPGKKKRRKGTVTGPDGKQFTMESSDEDDG